MSKAPCIARIPGASRQPTQRWWITTFFGPDDSDLALSKSTFADRVCSGAGSFADVDFDGFGPLFALIDNIVCARSASLAAGTNHG